MESLLLYVLTLVDLHFPLKFLITFSWNSIQTKTYKEFNPFSRLSLTLFFTITLWQKYRLVPCLAQVNEREHEVLIMAGGDTGPSLAGGSSTAALEFESCLLQHLSTCTITVLHGSGRNFLTLLLLLLLCIHILTALSPLPCLPVFSLLLLNFKLFGPS